MKVELNKNINFSRQYLLKNKISADKQDGGKKKNKKNVNSEEDWKKQAAKKEGRSALQYFPGNDDRVPSRVGLAPAGDAQRLTIEMIPAPSGGLFLDKI